MEKSNDSWHQQMCQKLPCMTKWLSHEILATIQNWESVKILLLYKLSKTLLPVIDLLWRRETLVIMTATVFECHVNILGQLFKSIISCLCRKDSSLLLLRVTQQLNWWCSAICGVLYSACLRWQHCHIFNSWGEELSSRKQESMGPESLRNITEIIRDQLPSALNKVPSRGSGRSNAGCCHCGRAWEGSRCKENGILLITLLPHRMFMRPDSHVLSLQILQLQCLSSLFVENGSQIWWCSCLLLSQPCVLWPALSHLLFCIKKASYHHNFFHPPTLPGRNFSNRGLCPASLRITVGKRHDWKCTMSLCVHQTVMT